MEQLGANMPTVLQSALQLVMGQHATYESAAAALECANTACQEAAHWEPAGSSTLEREALYGVVGSAASMLPLYMHTWQRQMRDAPAGPVRTAEQTLLQAAGQVLVACLMLAPACGTPGMTRLALARSAMQYVASAGPALVSCERDESVGGDLPAIIAGRLCKQFSLASLAMQTPGFSATSAAEAAPPQQFAAWLAAAVRALKRLESGQGGDQRAVLLPLLAVCHVATGAPAWEVHAEAAAKQPGLAQELVRLCFMQAGILAVALALPAARRPAGCTWNSAVHVFTLVTSNSLVPGDALLSYFQSADGGSTAAAIAAIAQLVQHMPLEPLPGETAQDRRWHVTAGATALGEVTAAVLHNCAGGRRLSSAQQRRVAAQLLAVMGRLPHLVQLLAGGQQQQLPPGMADEFGPGQAVSAGICLMGVLRILDKQHGQHGSSQQAEPLVGGRADAAAWCDAACAALQCVPLVQQVHSSGPRGNSPADFARVAVDFVGVATGNLIRISFEEPSNAATAARDPLHTSVWQLHTRLARLAHLLAAPNGARLASELNLSSILFALSECMAVAAQMHRMDAVAHADEPGAAPTLNQLPLGGRATKRLRALGAAHAAALHAFEGHMHLAFGGWMQAASTLGGLAAAIGHGPMAVGLDPALHRLFRKLWRIVVQEERQDNSKLWLRVLIGAWRGPCLAALLASNYLDAMLKSSDEEEGALVTAVCTALQSLRAASELATASPREAVASGSGDDSTANSAAAGGSGGSGGAPVAEETELQERLRQATVAFAAGLRACSPAAADPAASDLKRHILPPSRQLGAALLDWWRRPGAQQEQQLEAAQAAAKRSCAYLCCANLGGGGGPAAGEGEGGKRCSACRAVWYCGTACSHADWRAAHKHVCKALGAAKEARAAAVAARQQAASEVDG